MSNIYATKELGLRISVKEGEAAFYYTLHNQEHLLMQKVDVTNLSTKKAGGFVGSVIGMYATLNKE